MVELIVGGSATVEHEAPFEMTRCSSHVTLLWIFLRGKCFLLIQMSHPMLMLPSEIEWRKIKIFHPLI